MVQGAREKFLMSDKNMTSNQRLVSKKIFLLCYYEYTSVKTLVAESLQQITTLPPFGGCPGVKPPVGTATPQPAVDCVGLGEGISAP